MTTLPTENKISKDKNVLLVLQSNAAPNTDLQYLTDHFCGSVINSLADLDATSNKKVYVCGDLSNLTASTQQLYIIKELSLNFEDRPENSRIVSLGEVPVIISNAGVYYRKLFSDNNSFEKIKSEHDFQELTESNKESKAFRKGIYLSKITKNVTETGQEAFHYNLLRCSSNLTGPTDNFRDIDHQIINTLNTCVEETFEHQADMNHALVQIYENKKKNRRFPKGGKSKDQSSFR